MKAGSGNKWKEEVERWAVETNGRRRLKAGDGNKWKERVEGGKWKEEVESSGWKHMEGGG